MKHSRLHPLTGASVALVGLTLATTFAARESSAAPFIDAQGDFLSTYAGLGIRTSMCALRTS